MRRHSVVEAAFAQAIAKRTDPIFPAIEAHRVAWKAYMWAHKRYNADADIDPFFRTEMGTWKALMKTAPTTTIGAAELARYVSLSAVHMRAQWVMGNRRSHCR